MMKNALRNAKSNAGQGGIDEQSVMQAHKAAYQDGNAGSLDASSMGAAAAMKAFQSMAGGGGSSGGGGMQAKVMGMAMAEAGKLFDAQGGAASGSKEDAMSGAASTAMKLMMSSGAASSFIGGGNSGGLGGIASMASKFM